MHDELNELIFWTVSNLEKVKILFNELLISWLNLLFLVLTIYFVQFYKVSVSHALTEPGFMYQFLNELIFWTVSNWVEVKIFLKELLIPEGIIWNQYVFAVLTIQFVKFEKGFVLYTLTVPEFIYLLLNELIFWTISYLVEIKILFNEWFQWLSCCVLRSLCYPLMQMNSEYLK